MAIRQLPDLDGRPDGASGPNPKLILNKPFTASEQSEFCVKVKIERGTEAFIWLN